MRLTYVTVLCVLTSTVLAALLAPLGYLYARAAGREATGRLTAAAASVAPRVSEAVNAEAPPDSLGRLLTTLSRERHMEFSVLLPDGRVASSSADPAAAGRALRRPDPARTGTELHVAPVPLVPAGGSCLAVRTALPAGGRGRPATLLVRRPADELRGRVLTVWAALVALLPVGLLCCLLPLLVLRRRSLESVRHLGATLRALSEGAYHARAESGRHGHHLDELAMDVNQLAGTVQAAMEEYRAFLADVAHQLRNPMIALRLRIENLGPYLPDSAAERRTRLLADVDRLDRTLTDMLDHARQVPADRNTRVVDVCGVVEECVRGWATVAEQRAVQLRLSRPRHAWALARPGAVEQALNVLLDNALKHSPEGSAVRLSITASGARLRIDVRDEGPGLPHADREAALERGWRSGPAASSGIGLSIAAKLIESSGGRLELRAHESAGLSAVIHLAGAVPEYGGRPAAEGAPSELSGTGAERA
ncbi:sensor histidine kinase [Streptomyces sp. 8N706]|uniref:sensor histidine kinase n=1 Tax=Streptomyces sp. 8N706 TaxID=3457416 RepID=UPI003FD55C39